MQTTLGRMRRERGLRALDLAFDLRINPTLISSVERRKAAASARVRAMLAKFFGVSEGELFEPGGLAIEER